MKQCWITYIKKETNPQQSPFKYTKNNIACLEATSCLYGWEQVLYAYTVQCTPVPEFIDPVFGKTSPIRSFCMTENECFGLVFPKTGSINSGTALSVASSGRGKGTLTSSCTYPNIPPQPTWAEITFFDSLFLSRFSQKCIVHAIVSNSRTCTCP